MTEQDLANPVPNLALWTAMRRQLGLWQPFLHPTGCAKCFNAAAAAAAACCCCLLLQLPRKATESSTRTVGAANKNVGQGEVLIIKGSKED